MHWNLKSLRKLRFASNYPVGRADSHRFHSDQGEGTLQYYSAEAVLKPLIAPLLLDRHDDSHRYCL